MKGKTHAAVGTSVFVFLCNILPGKFGLINLVFAIVGSLLPDIDHPKSFVNRYLLPFRNQATKVTLFCSLGILMLYLDSIFNNVTILKIIGISLILIGVSTHRMGLTHSLLGLIIFSVVLSFFANIYELIYVEFYFFFSFFLHLICDMCTKRGVPLFYPFSNKKYKLPLTFTTGSFIGNFLEGAIIVLSIGYAGYNIGILFDIFR
ncbi:metal-dependent hydrolase [Clostridium sp. UBA4548]|uniref:metal-dependent hydrolase n=1 Tax=Clostridium sp. UBA4548 TaxID=1946361 RepID=UPI0025BC62C3|nr:metal-dependent hydrolase [Clostridium sp. UBA4548]